MDKIIEEAIIEYELGKKANEVAEKYNIKLSTLYYNLRKLNKTRPQGTGRIVSQDVKNKMSKLMSGVNNPNYGKFEDWMRKGLEIGQNMSLNENSIEKIRKATKKNWGNGIYDSNNYGGNARLYEIDGRICKGKNEKKFVLENKENNPWVLNKVDSIITPYGVYTPDFENKNFYIELKSTHTYDVLMGLYDYKKNKKGNLNQLKKINWVSENIKEVKIIIFYKNSFLSEDEYKKNI